jgi:hypothetical protein
MIARYIYKCYALLLTFKTGNYLGSSWLDTLKCISQLEAAQLIGDYGSRNTSRSSSPSPNNNQDGTSKGWVAWAGSFMPSFWDSSRKLDCKLSKWLFILI